MFDKINSLKAEPYDIYFSVMDITDEQENERIAFSEKMEDVMRFMFALILELKNNGIENVEYVQSTIELMYLNTIRDFYEPDEYLSAYVKSITNLLILATLNHLSDEYFTSLDRAMLISENEANTILNYVDYRRALSKGKTKKKWLTILDMHTRESHRDMANTVIPIDELFDVNGSLMRYPKDTEYGASNAEIINCRCTVKYF